MLPMIKFLIKYIMSGDSQRSKRALLSAIESHPKYKSGDSEWSSYHKSVTNATTPGHIQQIPPPPAKGIVGSILGRSKEGKAVENADRVLRADANREGIAQVKAATAKRARDMAAAAARKSAQDERQIEKNAAYDAEVGEDGLTNAQRREKRHKEAQNQALKQQIARQEAARQKAEEALLDRIVARTGITHAEFAGKSPNEQTMLRNAQLAEDEANADQQQAMHSVGSRHIRGGKTKRGRKRRTKPRHKKSTKKKTKSRRKTRRGKKHQKKRTRRR